MFSDFVIALNDTLCHTYADGEDKTFCGLKMSHLIDNHAIFKYVFFIS